MDIMELNDQITEIKNDIFSLSAVAGAFSNRYIESKDSIAAIKASPEDYAYLFYALLCLVKDAKDKVTDLETVAGRMLEDAKK